MEQSPLISDPAPPSSNATIPNSAKLTETASGKNLLQKIHDRWPYSHKMPVREIKTVTFDSSSHISVLFQMHGSVWPNVIPFCIANCLITLLVWYLKHTGHDVTCSKKGHKFMAMMVSFLIVTRSSIIYSRFMEARAYLSTLYKSCRDIVQMSCVLSMHNISSAAREWRQSVAYRTIILLRVAMVALEYNSTNQNAWDIVDLPSEECDNLKDVLVVNTPEFERPQKMRWAHGSRTLSDENFRAPVVLALELRKVICSHRLTFAKKDRLHVNEEREICVHTSEFLTAFHGLKKLVTTDFPFPLVQMARTFLFFWVFTLPFCLVREIRDPVKDMIIIFFITYGFVGLEYVSMELDDPFGDDPNDFDDLGMAQMVFEDIYLTLYKTDGVQSAEELRKKIISRMEHHSLENCNAEHENLGLDDYEVGNGLDP